MTLATKDIVKQLTDFPPFPKVTSKILALLQEDDTGANEIGELISTDPGMSAKIVKMSNSPFYMLSKPVECIQDAILVLGFETLKNLALGVSIQKGLNQYIPPTQHFDMTAFWRHSYATAIAGQHFDSKGTSGAGSKLYLAGLIHDIGKLFQGYFWPEAWKAMIHELSCSTLTYHELENKYFSMLHMEISTELCRSWSFSPTIINIVEQLDNKTTYNPAESADPLVIANAIAGFCSCPFPLEGAHKESEYLSEEYKAMKETILEGVNYQLKILST